MNIKKENELCIDGVDLESLLGIEEVVKTTEQSNHLLSCGGVYLPTCDKSEFPAPPRFDYLHLSNRPKTVVVLKNLEKFKTIQDQPALFDPEPQTKMYEPNLCPTLKKLLGNQLN